MKDESLKKCLRVECFANRGTGTCRALRDTKFRERGGKYPGDQCPFFKTVKQVDEWNAIHPPVRWR